MQAAKAPAKSQKIKTNHPKPTTHHSPASAKSPPTESSAVISRVRPIFWRSYQALDPRVREAARRSYELFSENPAEETSLRGVAFLFRVDEVGVAPGFGVRDLRRLLFRLIKTVGQFVDEIAEVIAIKGSLEGLADDALCDGLLHEEATVRGVWPAQARER